MKSIRRKIDLYILSLGLLFVFFLIVSTVLPSAPFTPKDSDSWKQLATSNPLPMASILALMYCLFAYLRFDFDLKGATDIPFEITKIEDINYEHLTFLATYVVPLISFDFGSSRQGIVLICRGRLIQKQKVSYIKLDDRIYFVRRG